MYNGWADPLRLRKEELFIFKSRDKLISTNSRLLYYRDQRALGELSVIRDCDQQISVFVPEMDVASILTDYCELPRPKGHGFPLHRQNLHH
jgi:hypothetical protein